MITLLDAIKNTRRLRAVTRRYYVGRVEEFLQFAEGKPSAENLERWLAHLTTDRKLDVASAAIYLGAVRFASRHWDGPDFAADVDPPAAGIIDASAALRAMLASCDDGRTADLRDRALLRTMAMGRLSSLQASELAVRHAPRHADIRPWLSFLRALRIEPAGPLFLRLGRSEQVDAATLPPEGLTRLTPAGVAWVVKARAKTAGVVFHARWFKRAKLG